MYYITPTNYQALLFKILNSGLINKTGKYEKVHLHIDFMLIV